MYKNKKFAAAEPKMQEIAKDKKTKTCGPHRRFCIKKRGKMKKEEK